ncbi:MAG: type II toxin-antitoxin system Phd/YefM family antitoxin [Nitrosomonas sp.]|nr:type II toxin-antitoxin system Phd/YefM family antitoxin [Nitrosomonas sp.]MCW5607392.1 type II toxin-antitoxin system Phd/YefM family antitoxin [Nitrosomonas sp.]
MKTIKASEFKAKCLQLMNEVADSGDSIVITKNGQPVAQLCPVISRPATLAGCHKGTMGIVGDIVAPLGESWDAECLSS